MELKNIPTSYEGTQVETQHRTIYLQSNRELTEDEQKDFMQRLVDADVDNLNIEPGVTVVRGSTYYNERRLED